MSTTDWIALIQAAFLAVAAIFGWRTYRLATREHQETREEARKAPLRDLLADVVREFKLLAFQAQERVPGVGIQYLDKIAGQQQRLGIALTFLPPDVFNLFATEALSKCSAQEVTPNQIEKARGELLTLFARIDDGEFSIREVAPLPMLVERHAKEGRA